MRNITLVCIFITGLLTAVPLAAQTVADEKKSAVLPMNTLVAEPMSIEMAIDLVLRSNLTLRSAKYDIIMSDTDYQKYLKKYGPTVNLEGGYLEQKYPDSPNQMFTGTDVKQTDISASLSKLFSSGTMISAGVREIFKETTFPPSTLPAPFNQIQFGESKAHTPSFFVSVQQELLKNAFGMNDRKEEAIKQNTAQMQRRAVINLLPGLVVGALVDYWSVSVQKYAVENAKLELESDRNVRNIIARNVQYGLAQAYDLNQYNALVAVAETKLGLAQQRYREAVRKLLRTVNMPPETEVKGVTDFVETLPALNTDAALKAAFAKRVDYQNAKLQLENSKMDLAVQENNSLPSLTLNLSGSTASDDPEFTPAFKDASAAQYPAWQVRGKLSYPLDDTDQKAGLRNAEFRTRQAKLTLDNLTQEVRDEVINRLEQVKLQHQVLLNARTARSESDLFYERMLVKFRQGKVNSIFMKNAVDAMVQSRQAELEALVQYNVALLQFDLAKNEVFERYNVNVEKYLAMIKE